MDNLNKAIEAINNSNGTTEQKARDLFTLRVKNWYDNSSLFAFITKKND